MERPVQTADTTIGEYVGQLYQYSVYMEQQLENNRRIAQEREKENERRYEALRKDFDSVTEEFEQYTQSAIREMPLKDVPVGWRWAQYGDEGGVDWVTLSRTLHSKERVFARPAPVKQPSEDPSADVIKAALEWYGNPESSYDKKLANAVMLYKESVTEDADDHAPDDGWDEE